MKKFKKDALLDTITVRQMRDYLNWLVKRGEGDHKIIKALEPRNINPDINGPHKNYEDLYPEVPIYQDMDTEGHPYII